MEGEPIILRRREIAERLGVSESWVTRHGGRFQLPSGRGYVVPDGVAWELLAQSRDMPR